MRQDLSIKAFDMTKHMLLALSNPLPGRDQDLAQWLDEYHIPDVLKAPGFVSACRYELSSEQYKPGPHPYRYATVYEVEADDLKSAFGALTAAVQAGTKTDSRDRTQMALWVFTPAGPKRFAGEAKS
jgi:hypothetical protein